MPRRSRLSRLRLAIGAADLDALAVVPGPNMVFLTGLHFHLSERPVLLLVPASGKPRLVLPELEAGKVDESGFSLFAYDDVGGPAAAVGKALASLRLGGKRLGVETRRLRFLELELLTRGTQAPELTGADEVFASLRIQKESPEIEAMRRAVDMAQQAILALLPRIRVGMTERDLASALTLQILAAGSDPALPFAPIVAAGPNGALPHAVPTDRRLLPGDLVTFDWGAAHDGYFSDITRTYHVAGGALSAELVRIYDVVRAANDAARAAVRPGASGQDVDRAARAVIDEAGFGQYFVHRTGHGLGLEGHEEPDIKEGSTAPLLPGMTFTVEPGVYVPGLGGVRIEDDVVVTEDGSECLSTLPRELESVG